MKRLVVHLLRLGDVLMAAPVLKALKQQYPEDELHLLINRQFSQAAPVLENYVDKILYFDRKRMQNSLGTPDSPIFESYDLVRQVIKRLNDEKFDEVINLTQNRLAGRLIDAITAPIKYGLQLSNSNAVRFNNPWFSFLEDHVAGEQKSPFHNVDALLGGSGLDKDAFIMSTLDLSSKNANQEMDDSKDEPYVCVQVCTADAKKTLPRAKWVELLEKTFHSTGFKQVLFAGPGEVDYVKEIESALIKKNVRVQVYSEGLVETFNIISKSKGLITVDTSIKHLAALGTTPIIEFAMGSSVSDFTGTYKENSLIISSKEACAPCKHSESCYKESQLCATSFESTVVSQLISSYLAENYSRVKLLAGQMRFQLKVELTKREDLGFWSKIELGKELSLDDLEVLLDKMAWFSYLDRTHLDPIGLTGTHAYKLIYFLENNYSQSSVLSVVAKLDRLEKKLVAQTEQIKSLLLQLFNALRSENKNESLLQFMSELSQFILSERWSRPIKEAVRSCIQSLNQDKEPSFHLIRKIQIELNDLNVRNRSKLRIAQMIRSNERMQDEQNKRP